MLVVRAMMHTTQALLAYIGRHAQSSPLSVWVEFFLAQCAYAHAAGRLSALEMLHALFTAKKDDHSAIDPLAMLAFVKLGAQLAKEDDQQASGKARKWK